MNDPSMERIVPHDMDLRDVFTADTLKLHQERYQFAIQQLRPGRILDIACGTGYGSFQMASAGKLEGSRYTSVDISSAAIAYARKRYAHPSIEFICEDALKFNDELLFDGIVSLETIEHFRDPGSLVFRLYELLKPGGILIASAPVTPSTDGNPYHFSDFSSAGFRELFTPLHFEETAHLLQVQSYLPYLLGFRKNLRHSRKKNGLWKFYLNHPGVFYSRICSLLKEGLNNKYLILALKKP